MMSYLFFIIPGESNDVGEMRTNPCFVAQTNDVCTLSRVIVEFTCFLERFAIEGFNPHEHFITACATEQLHEIRVLGDLGIALAIKWHVQAFVYHRLQELTDLGKLVEVVRYKFDDLHTATFCAPQALHRALDTRAAHLPPGYFNNGAKVAFIRAASHRI